MNTQATPLLSVRDLDIRFRIDRKSEPFRAVKGISFDIPTNSTVALVGESGSGKSVSAMAILGLLPDNAIVAPESQAIYQFSTASAGGRDLLKASLPEMQALRGKDISVIFQEPMTSLNPVFTVGEQIAESLRLHMGMTGRQAKDRVVELLAEVGIPNPQLRANSYPHEMSGGQQQRVMIAMAIACEPKLLIADEPTTALDVTIQKQILELLAKLQEKHHMSVLFITHDMGVVAEIADRTVVMYNGEAVETGETTDIFTRAKHPYTRSLLSAVPKLGSMEGHKRPMRFPVVDRLTGESDVPVEVPDTVEAAARPVLEVSGLTTRFDIRTGLLSRVTGRVHAVENVSFSVQGGETLALVGESGCGKSTTGRSVMRLIEPQAGSVLLDGVDVLKLDQTALREQRKRMQMIFQDPFASLNPRMNIGTAIAEPLIINNLATRAQAREQVAELLRRVGLSPDMSNRFPHEFSGGQRQRICIARALAVEPRLIVADESVSALDVSVKAQVINLMLELQARMKLAYLFISHDMAVVERVSHRVAVMYLGEIVEIGPREAIFGNPQHPYTKRLLAAVPIADPARRHEKAPPSNDEIKSPVRSADFVPPVRQFREVSPGHAVMIWGEEWEKPAVIGVAA